MTSSINEPFAEGIEGDRVEQAQDVNGNTPAADVPSVPSDQASEADALEQGIVIDDEDL